ncbi:histone-lysine N-methyltransferase 2D-like [Onychostoma macrolepis]|uniref:histone-lysine N-methyltransferase 2D-like n=1 Tax=Onychostoma macrolepis TaxID=369639 RepID=UPI00272CB30E|nr:histone-lysine N-methyltransferase 2D-like [Onychostoma macrolepis]XP_058617496.1 histone-lysine N-methyltransferase 2D-like [Onychostoma macrolepis]XP_058617497.1 histone-lysine N-methyltransferase 2D-like [Onychostoma macrolepis]
MLAAETRLWTLRQAGWRLERYVEEFCELAHQLSWRDAVLGACFLQGLDDDIIRCDLPSSDFPLKELLNLVLLLNDSNFEIHEVVEPRQSSCPAHAEARHIAPAHLKPGTPTYRTNRSDHLPDHKYPQVLLNTSIVPSSGRPPRSTANPPTERAANPPPRSVAGLLVPSSSPSPPLVPSSSPSPPLVQSSSPSPPLVPPSSAPPERIKESALPERPPVPAPRRRLPSSALPERPLEIALPERPPVPAPRRRLPVSVLQERPLEFALQEHTQCLRHEGASLSPRYKSATQNPRCKSAPQCLRHEGASLSPCCQSAPKSPHCPSGPKNPNED